MKRGPHKDPVTPELHAEILRLDEWRCAAPRVDPGITECADRWGRSAIVGWLADGTDTPLYRREALTLDHVKDQPKIGDPVVKRPTRRAPSDVDHLVTLCWHHHLDGWATSHRPELRDWIRSRNAAAFG